MFSYLLQVSYVIKLSKSIPAVYTCNVKKNQFKTNKFRATILNCFSGSAPASFKIYVEAIIKVLRKNIWLSTDLGASE